MESVATPRLAWKWIVEELLDNSDFGVKHFNELMDRHVKDIEEPHCLPLQDRLALRHLEDMVLRNQIDPDAIPLMEALTKQDLGPETRTGASVKQRFRKELFLRTQTEVALSVLRKDGPFNWALYEAELERVFVDAEEDNRLLDRKRELSALLVAKYQTPATVASYFERYALKKLLGDLMSFIEEKKESLPITFLGKLSREFCDADGRPFAEDVEKPANAVANEIQDHVGETSKVHETEDLGIMCSGQQRLRRKLLLTPDNESDEAEEGSARFKKSRSVSLTSIVEPLLHRGVLEQEVPASGRRSGCLSMNQDVLSCKRVSLLNRDEEPLFCLGNLVMKGCNPVAHERISMDEAKTSPVEPSCQNECIVISDVESDADTQVAKTSRTDVKDSVNVEGGGDKHKKKEAQSFHENGHGRGHPQTVVKAEICREKTIVPTEETILADRREDCRGSPGVSVSQREDSIQPDSQDTYEVDLLEIGSDGYEIACHVCGNEGTLCLCDGCRICMHFDCIKGLGLQLPERRKDWYCPVCVSKRTAQEAVDAEKAAGLAKEKLKAFKMKSKRKRNLPDRDDSRAEKGIKRTRLKSRSLETGENDRALKPKQQSDDELKQGQLDSDPSMESLFPTVVSKGLTHLKQRNSDRSSPADNPQSNQLDSSRRTVSIRDVNLHEPQLSHDREVSRRDRFAASTSRQSKTQREIFTRSSKKNRTGVDIGEESGEQARAGYAEPAIEAGGPSEMEDDKDDEDLPEDRSEGECQVAVFSGRERIPGIRRKNLPWTRKEECTLKEGVKRFSHNGTWGFQWKRILEFGEGRFDPSRTHVDLKDKWRNLVKGVS